MKVIGIEKVNYTSKKTGQPVSGYRLHCSYEKKNCDGFAVVADFVSASAIGDVVPVPGDTVEYSYNRYGRVDSVCVVD